MNTPDSNNPAILPLADQKKKEEPVDPAQADYKAGLQFLDQDDTHGQAANAFHNALIGFEQSNNEEGMAKANDKLGDICLARDEFDKAISHYQNAYDICKRHDDLFSGMALRKKFAGCYRGLRQFDEAITIYLDLLETYEKINNPASAVDTFVILGDVYLEKGDPAQAVDAYKTAASIHANFKHSRQAQELLDKAKAIEEKMDC